MFSIGSPMISGVVSQGRAVSIDLCVNLWKSKEKQFVLHRFSYDYRGGLTGMWFLFYVKIGYVRSLSYFAFLTCL